MMLTPRPAEAPQSSLVHMFEVIGRKAGAVESSFVGRVGEDRVWRIDFDAATARLRQASGGGVPMILMGTAFSFVHLLDWMSGRELRLELPPGSRVMETGGYKGRSREVSKLELHRMITHRLGVPPDRIFCEYGMSELSSQAYGCGCSMEKDAVLAEFAFPPWVRARVISPETNDEVAEGEAGLLRIVDLANVFSVTAIQTEDRAVRRGGGFELIGRAAQAEARGCSLTAIEYE
jgi:hypothetical protein